MEGNTPPLVERKTRKSKKGESSPDSFKIEGYILLMVTDTIFPYAFSFLNNMFDKTRKIEANQLQLGEKEMSKLEPLADQAASYLSININPIAGFLIVSAMMYSNNLLYLRSNIEPNKK